MYRIFKLEKTVFILIALFDFWNVACNIQGLQPAFNKRRSLKRFFN